MVQITVPASQGLLIIGAGVLGCGVGVRVGVWVVVWP